MVEEKKEITREYVEQVYNELGHYIIIGLTGRCGSGCSTTRDILCVEGKLNPEDYMGNISNGSEHNIDRDRKVILDFAEKNPLHFDSIKVRDILTSYILENIEAFFELLNYMFPDICGDGKKLRNDFCNFFNSRMGGVNDGDTPLDVAIKTNSQIWKKINENIYHFIEKIDEEQYDFLFKRLERISTIIKEFLGEIGDENQYTAVYQYVGNIVRTYGELKELSKCTCYDDASKTGMYAVAKRINAILKIMRKKEWILANYTKEIDKREMPIKESNVHVVIDCIKNVFEAEYFKVRYHSFYLVALTLDDDVRKERLKINKGLNNFQIEVIDSREQPSKAKKLLKDFAAKEQPGGKDKNKGDNSNKKQKPRLEVYNRFFGENNKCSKIYKMAYESNTYSFRLQDVDGCIQNADILINNGGTKEKLGLIIMRYVCLMQHPGLVLPTVDERCMQVAQAAKLNSGCISRQVGAVVSDAKGNILSIGWNDAATTDGNECISCIRRSFQNLIYKKDSMAYSYYELYDPEFRKKLLDIMKKTCEIGDRDSSEEPTEELITAFIDKVKKQAHGVPLVFCFKDIYSAMTHDHNQVHTRAQHGEENALEACDRSKCSGGTLYTTSSSCELCAKKALSYNIRRIVYIEPYSGITNEHVLGHEVENGVKIRRDNMTRIESMKVELFTGATQNAYTRLYTPIFPLKDELKLRGINLK